MSALADAFAQAWAAEGVLVLCAGAAVAGLVRGFSGFGTAMIYLPVAAQVLGPFEALTTLLIMDFFGPLPNLPRALRDGHPGDVARLLSGLVMAAPVGVFVLTLVAPEVFRYAVSILAICLVTLLILGLRYRGPVTKPMVVATGAAGGFLGGSSGLPGPPVILFYMASPHGPSVIRANTMLYLWGSDIAMVAILYLGGLMVPSALATGFIVMLPYLLANVAGAAIFRPGAERVYRAVAYLIILGSAITGLPIWTS